MCSITRRRSTCATTGSQFPGRPCLGSWVTYGLGYGESESAGVRGDVGWVDQDPVRRRTAPAFCRPFIKARYSEAGRIRFCISHSPPASSRDAQRDTLDFIEQMDRMHWRTTARRFDARSAHRLLRTCVPHAERRAGGGGFYQRDRRPRESSTASTIRLTEDFGHKCLLARRLVERGVRFIQLYSGTNVGDDWDNAHTDLIGSHTRMAGKTDKPIAALLRSESARAARFDAGGLERRIRPHASVAGTERPRPSSVRIQCGWRAAASRAVR